MPEKKPVGVSDYAYEKYVKPIREREKERVRTAAIEYENSAAGRHEKLLKEIASDTKSLDELKRIADAAETRARIAEEEAQSAKKDARFSKVISVLALLVSVGSLAVAVISIFV